MHEQPIWVLTVSAHVRGSERLITRQLTFREMLVTRIDVDGRLTYVSNRIPQPLNLLLTEPANGAGRMNSRRKERFVGDPVAHASRKGLIEDQALDS